MTAEIETMFSHRERPWHGLGTVVEDAPTSEDAIELAGLNWKVERRPVYVDDERIPDRVGLVRDKDHKVYGIVSERYKILQNNVAFSIIDEIMGEGVRYETAGSLKDGEQVFMTCPWEHDWEVGGDKIKTYLLLSNSHNGKESLHITITPIRVVCWNTLQAALKENKSNFSIPHFSSMKERIKIAQTTLQRTAKYMQEFCEYGERKAEQKVGEGAFEKLLELIFPHKEGESFNKRMDIEFERRRFVRCANAPDLSQFKGTAWALINAASDYETHFKKYKRERLMRDTLNADLTITKQVMEFVNA